MPSDRHYPALEITWPGGALDEDVLGRMLAAVDDEHPVAVEEDTGARVRIFFQDHHACGRAERAVRGASESLGFGRALMVRTISVSDESWAERSQQAIGAVTIGQIVVAPPWVFPVSTDHPRNATWISIQPSMGFGTGHHQTTRLCLALLQDLPLSGASVLDVGTGSGVLAIAAARLGAARVLAVDADADAIASARENIDANGVAGTVSAAIANAGEAPARLGSGYDLVLANLTGATLVRLAATLVSAVRPAGALVLGGLLADERQAVLDAFAGCGSRPEKDASEDEWAALLMRRGDLRSIPTPSKAS